VLREALTKQHEKESMMLKLTQEINQLTLDEVVIINAKQVCEHLE
jgi:hypothetical protein